MNATTLDNRFPDLVKAARSIARHPATQAPFYGKPANTLAAMLAAIELDIPTYEAVNRFTIVDDRLTLKPTQSDR